MTSRVSRASARVAHHPAAAVLPGPGHRCSPSPLSLSMHWCIPRSRAPRPVKPATRLKFDGSFIMEACSYAGSYPGPTSKHLHLAQAFLSARPVWLPRSSRPCAQIGRRRALRPTILLPRHLSVDPSTRPVHACETASTPHVSCVRYAHVSACFRYSPSLPCTHVQRRVCTLHHSIAATKHSIVVRFRPLPCRFALTASDLQCASAVIRPRPRQIAGCKGRSCINNARTCCLDVLTTALAVPRQTGIFHDVGVPGSPIASSARCANRERPRPRPTSSVCAHRTQTITLSCVLKCRRRPPCVVPGGRQRSAYPLYRLQYHPASAKVFVSCTAS